MDFIMSSILRSRAPDRLRAWTASSLRTRLSCRGWRGCRRTSGGWRRGWSCWSRAGPRWRRSWSSSPSSSRPTSSRPGPGGRGEARAEQRQCQGECVLQQECQDSDSTFVRSNPSTPSSDKVRNFVDKLDKLVHLDSQKEAHKQEVNGYSFYSFICIHLLFSFQVCRKCWKRHSWRTCIYNKTLKPCLKRWFDCPNLLHPQSELWTDKNFRIQVFICLDPGAQRKGPNIPD